MIAESARPARSSLKLASVPYPAPSRGPNCHARLNRRPFENQTQAGFQVVPLRERLAAVSKPGTYASNPIPPAIPRYWRGGVGQRRGG